MMEHIRQFDWCDTSRPTSHFVEESALDNSNIEKMLRHKFRDPLLSSDEEEPSVIDWGTVFVTRAKKNASKVYCPGLRALPPYPKLSVLTGTQHYQCLKVLSMKHPHVLELQHFPKPTPLDRRCLESLKEIYENEQKEFIEWSKSLWESSHCIRALRPKPIIETVYEAEFKVRAQRLSGYPTQFDMAAQIPLECGTGHTYEATLENTLIDVKITDMPSIQLPILQKNVNIFKSNSLPEPCHKHPYQFVLPNERTVSILPITELHRELSQYAAEHNTKYVASENALRCLVAFNRYWSVPVTVCPAFTPDGESINVVVLDSEFSIHKEPAMMRTYRASRHLLEHALIPSSEMEKRIEAYKGNNTNLRNDSKEQSAKKQEADSDDDEPLGLVIFEDDESKDSLQIDETAESKDKKNQSQVEVNPTDNNTMSEGAMSVDAINDIIGVYSCTCTDTLYEVPPQRSFKKWRITDRTNNETHHLIVHCPHKTKLNSGEVIVEPVPEYQLELGGSDLPPDRVRSLAVSLMLRDNASALTVRMDASNGDLVTYDEISSQQFISEHKVKCQQVINVIHTTLNELEGLLPGHYVLQHEPNHGANAFLFVARPNGDKLSLNFDSSQLIEVDEAKMVKTPPTITPVLMPAHKQRKILPCAFTPFENQIAKEQKKPPTRQKTPPQAIKWPKKGNKKKKKGRK